MNEPIVALLVHDHAPHMHALGRLLKQNSDLREAGTLPQVRAEVEGKQAPAVIFVDLHLADGAWKGVVKLASQSACLASVIVVSREEDACSDREAFAGGAFGSLAPPFRAEDLGLLLRYAAKKTVARRKEQLDGFLAALLAQAAAAGTRAHAPTERWSESAKRAADW